MAARKAPPKVRKVERLYERQLRKVAQHVGDIIAAYPPGTIESATAIETIMRKYSATLTGWATITARRMLESVDLSDARAWKEHSAEMGRLLREEIRQSDAGQVMQQLLAEQVELIKSIPLEAAERVHRLTLENIENSGRSTQIAAEILRSNEVAKSRATLIARTEVARTASKLTEARARSVGSEGYIWRTSRDADVRSSHRQMEGAFVRWDENGGEGAHLSDGTTCHAGQIYNCRCYPEPVIPE